MLSRDTELVAKRPEAVDRGARLDTLVDGVMAIVVTLLVLDLRMPEGVGALDSEGVWAALHAMREQLVSYLFSFLVAGVLWLRHVQSSRGGPVNGMRIWLSFAFLGAVTLIPFTTALLSRNGSAVATAVYASVMAFASFVLGIMAMRADTEVTARTLAGHFAVPAVFLLSLPVAAWNVPAARMSWLLVATIPFLFRRRDEAPPDNVLKETVL